MALVGRDSAEDLLSTLFIKATEKPPKSGVNLKAWLARVMKNEAIDLQRATRSRIRREERVGDRIGNYSPRRDLEESEARETLHQSLNELDQKSQKILRLRYFQHFTPPEIAQEIGVTVPAARVRLTRALSALRRLMKTKLGEDWSGYCMLVMGREFLAPSKRAIEGSSVLKGKTLLSPVHWISLWTLISAVFFLFSILTDNGREGSENLIAAQASVLHDQTELLNERNEEATRVELPVNNIPNSVYVMDYLGGAVIGAQVIILGSENAIRCEKREEHPGHYYLKKALPYNPVGEVQNYLLITSFGHAPYLVPIHGPFGILTVKLPRKGVVSGHMDFSKIADPGTQFLSLGVQEIQPKVGSKEYIWRKKLSRSQQGILDDAFHSAAIVVQEDGSFEIDGLADNWEGPLYYLDQFFRLEGGLDWNGFQNFWVAGPRSDIWLTLNEKFFMEGVVRNHDGSPLSSELNISGVFSKDQVTTSNWVEFDHVTGVFRIYFDEVPQGELWVWMSRNGGSNKYQIQYTKGDWKSARIQLDQPKIRSLRVTDDFQNPLEGIKVLNFNLSVADVSDADGFVHLELFDRSWGWNIDNPNWMPIVVDLNSLKSEYKLRPRTGVHFLPIEIGPGETQKGFFSASGHSLVLYCESGLAWGNISERELNEIYSSWGNFQFNPLTGRLVGMETWATFGYPIFAPWVGVEGTTEVRIRHEGKNIWEMTLHPADCESGKVFRCEVQRDRRSRTNFQVLEPNGTPARFAFVCQPEEAGISKLLRVDGFGMGAIEELDPELPVYARKLGYHSSRLVSVSEIVNSEDFTFQLSPGRVVDFSLHMGPDALKGSRIKCLGIRKEDGFEFFRSDSAEDIEIHRAPIGVFEIVLQGNGWEYRFECNENEVSKTIEIPSFKELTLHFEDGEYSANSLDRIEFICSNGIWSCHDLKVNSFDGTALLKIPVFTDIIALRVKIGVSTWQEFPIQIREVDDHWEAMLPRIR